MAPSLVLDLDGTLINSSPGILSALSLSLNEYGYESLKLSAMHVGPPLVSVFRTLLPWEAESRINQLCDSFRYHYDNSEYLHFNPYEGIAEALNHLVHHDFRLFIVTNKRSLPTKQIIDLLGWNYYFDFIYCLDMCCSQLATKANSLANLLTSFDLDPSRTPYLGDRLEDYKAASSVSMPFLFAKWGYASPLEQQDLAECACIASPLSLLSSSFLQSICKRNF